MYIKSGTNYGSASVPGHCKLIGLKTLNMTWDRFWDRFWDQKNFSCTPVHKASSCLCPQRTLNAGRKSCAEGIFPCRLVGLSRAFCPEENFAAPLYVLVPSLSAASRPPAPSERASALFQELERSAISPRNGAGARYSRWSLETRVYK